MYPTLIVHTRVCARQPQTLATFVPHFRARMKARRDWVLSLALNAVLAAAQGNLLLTDVNSGDDEGTWCLDSGYGGSNQVNVRMSRCTASSTSQLWLFDGSALKTEANSTWCLDWTWKPGRKNVHMSLCSQSSAHQRWRFDERFLKTDTGEADGAGAWCMDWTTHGQKDVYMNECSGVYPHQHWRWISSPSSSSSLADRLLPIVFVLVPSVLVGFLLLGGLAYLCHKRVRRRRGPGYTSSTEIAVENSVQASNADVTHADVQPEVATDEGEDPWTAKANVLGRSRATVERESKKLIKRLQEQKEKNGGEEQANRYVTETLEFSEMADSTLELEEILGVDESEISNKKKEGLAAICKEFEDTKCQTAIICVKYVLFGEAGSDQSVFDNGNLMMDCDSHRNVLSDRRGWKLEQFATHQRASLAKLSLAETAALRIYTTAAYRLINEPLRKKERPHPLPLTVTLIHSGVRKLRIVDANNPAEKNRAYELYRGVRDRKLAENFSGGGELAPMSTTTNFSVALQYSASKQCVLFRIHTNSALERGADLSFLSAFPGEREYLYPPLTYLQPKKGQDGEPVEPCTVELAAGVNITVVEVEPKMS